MIPVGYSNWTGRSELSRHCDFTWYVCADMKASMPDFIQKEMAVAQFSMGRLKILFQGASQRKSWNESQSVCLLTKNVLLICLMIGFPGYIHSDRGTSFLSKEIKAYLLNKGISTRQHPTTPVVMDRQKDTMISPRKQLNLPLCQRNWMIVIGSQYSQTPYTTLDLLHQFIRNKNNPWWMRLNW